MVNVKQTAYDDILQILPGFVLAKAQNLRSLPLRGKQDVTEIRFRANIGVSLEYMGNRREKFPAYITVQDLDEMVKHFCGYSVHSHAKQFSEGFITLKGGHRAGFCGTAAVKNDTVEYIRDITSVNIRVAKEFKGCSDTLYGTVIKPNFKGLIIAGVPLSAKTTMLRDLIRNISCGHKIAVIDERGEIAAMHNGKSPFDLGENTDVLNAFPKRAGFITALRTLSPEFIACDEIGIDTEEILQCFNSGVKLILTLHCGNVNEINRELLNMASHVALLSKTPGKAEKIYEQSDIINSIYNPRNIGGNLQILKTAET